MVLASSGAPGASLGDLLGCLGGLLICLEAFLGASWPAHAARARILEWVSPTTAFASCLSATDGWRRADGGQRRMPASEDARMPARSTTTRSSSQTRAATCTLAASASKAHALRHLLRNLLRLAHRVHQFAGSGVLNGQRDRQLVRRRGALHGRHVRHYRLSREL